MDISNPIFINRRAQKLKQSDLARISGVSVPTIIRYESGAIPDNDKALIRITKALKIEPDKMALYVGQKRADDFLKNYEKAES